MIYVLPIVNVNASISRLRASTGSSSSVDFAYVSGGRGNEHGESERGMRYHPVYEGKARMTVPWDFPAASRLILGV